MKNTKNTLQYLSLVLVLFLFSSSTTVFAAETTNTQTGQFVKSGPAYEAMKDELEQENDNTLSELQYTKGTSLGIFTTSGYCNCDLCCSGQGLTYAGTVPQSNYTISADLDFLPLGTQVMIHDIVYTVEDMGGHVEGNWLDIYYDNHQDALAHGLQTVEVFTVSHSTEQDTDKQDTTE